MDRTALKTAAAKYGTPLYLFDLDAFTARAEKVRAAFGSHVQLCYSMKANPFVLRGLPDVFRWVEVCSPGELTICEKLGIAPERILYSGVNKGADDVARAVALGADLLTAESTLHFDLICAAAAAQGKHVRVLPRLTAGSQFGMDPAALEALVARRAEFPNVTIAGIHYFSGTQKRKDAVIAKELAHLDEYLTMLHDKYGFTAQHVEYGPGLNAECLRDDAEARDGALLDAAAAHIRAFGEKYPLTIEMGRFFAAPCGTFLTGVADAKCNLGVNYAVCDGGMHQVKYDGQLMGMQSPPLTLLRESADAAEPWMLCGSLCTTADVLVREAQLPPLRVGDGGMHQVKYDGQLMGMQSPPLTLLRESADAAEPWMLCGSLCTTADVLVREAQLPPLRVGDVIAFGRCGAYSVTEGVAVFLSRDMPRVALCRGGDFTLVRDRFATDVLNTCRTPEDEA